MGIALKTVAVLVLVLSLNLQWVLLQTVAWTGMVISYSRVASFTTALEMTFDGKHPCALCKVVEAGRSAAKHSDLQPSKLLVETEPGLVWEAIELDFTCDPAPIPSADFFTGSDSITPPKPPPRGLLPDNPTRV